MFSFKKRIKKVSKTRISHLQTCFFGPSIERVVQEYKSGSSVELGILSWRFRMFCISLMVLRAEQDIEVSIYYV